MVPHPRASVDAVPQIRYRSRMSRWITRILSLWIIVLSLPASAQLVTSLELSKREYLAGEQIVATISITNHSGRDLSFVGDPRLSWLDFVIKSNQNQPIAGRGQPNFGALNLPAGQTVARKVDLTSLYGLSQPGGFSVNAVVRMPSDPNNASATQRVFFNIVPGRTYWTQKVGITGRTGMIREYRLLTYSSTERSQLYIQVIEDRTGVPVRTFSLGEAMLLRKPMVTVDSKQRMHVLYLATPTMWIHCQIDTDGKLLARNVHQRAAQGDPSLVTFADGSVTVANSIPIDLEAVAAAKAAMKKLSDRPQFVYE